MSSKKTTPSSAGKIDAVAPLQGLRARSKLEKLGRIRAAALQLFETKGYDATTTREIAEMADVAIGTVFMYANDKRDLLFLLFNDQLDELVDGAFAHIDRRQPLSAQVHEAFSHLYVAFHQKAGLARLLLKELVFFSEGKQAGQFMENRRRLMAGLEGLIRAAIDKGSVPASDDPEMLASAFFYLYSGEVRMWLSADEPDLADGLERLRQAFSLLGRGCGESSASQRRRAGRGVIAR